MSKKLILAAYVLVWLSPALCYLFADFRVESAAKVLVTAVFFIAWHLAFGSFRRAVNWSLPVFLILLPFDLFFFSIYREPPGTPVLLAIGNSNMIEASDFMRGRAASLIVFVVLGAGVWLMAQRAFRHLDGRGWGYNPLAQRLAQCAVGGTAVLTVLFATEPSAAAALTNSGHARLAGLVQTTDQALLAPLANMRPIFPLGRFVSIAEFCRESTYLRLADQRRALFRYQARQRNAPPGRQIYVLVIGETARADRFGLNGYTRGLPSFLAGRENVIPLPNIVAPFTYTHLSVPAMLTPETSGGEGSRESERSLVSAFREAGFKTYWISNQQPMGMRETEVSHFSREADETVFMNMSIRTMHMDGLYDEHLLAPLSKFLARNEPKQFFVLHLLGSHDSYERRYPPAFDQFRPSLRALVNPDQHDPRNKLEVENSYDNAMRYTDYVLARMIDTIASQHAVSALVYSADHGETLFDDQCGRSGHGSTGKQEFPVAAMVWVSGEYKAARPQRFQRLMHNASAPITTEAILPTLLDMASIETPELDHAGSLASATFETRTRWVHAPDPIDWDSATTRGACHLLVGHEPKGKEQLLAKGQATLKALAR